MTDSKTNNIFLGIFLIGIIAIPMFILISSVRDNPIKYSEIPMEDPYPHVPKYSALVSLTPYEDWVFLELPTSIAGKRDNQMVDITFKSADLIYTIKILKKLLSFITLSPDVQYQITWNKYLYQRKVISNGEYKIKETEYYCWDQVKDVHGKILIYAGDEVVMGARDSSNRCLVPMQIKARQ